jgi:hypothetical protein
VSATKHDSGKLQLDLFPWPAVPPVTRVQMFGARKYAAENWREGFTTRRLIAAAFRHLTTYFEGQDLDPESGLPHTDHAACMILYLIALRELGRLTDDRPVAGLYRLLEKTDAEPAEVRPAPAGPEVELLPRP